MTRKVRNMKKRTSAVPGFSGLVPIVVAFVLILVPSLLSAQDGGGQSGADFLLNPSAPRADSMGGVLDGQGDPLEGMFFNPSVLMLDPNIALNIGITPYPNGVTDAALSLGIPIGPGMLGVAGELVSLGEFTFINDVGQPQGSVTVFDAQGAAGYAMDVWNHLSVGGSAKFVYRTLGDSSAIAGGIDAGATWWFETPHIGQRPKPPTVEQLEAQRDRELSSIESELARRTREAAGDVADLRDELAGLEADLDRLNEKLGAAEEGDDTSSIEASIAETEANIDTVQSSLTQAEDAAADDLAAVDAWHKQAVDAANARHAARVADLREVESERARLFAVVDDPETMLTADAIISNIEDAIARTREFERDRKTTLREQAAAYRSTRDARLAEIGEQIIGYEAQIAELAGSDVERLRREIQDLEARIAELEASGSEADADQARTLKDTVKAKQNELDALQNDPWVRRLQRRIEDKDEEAAAIEAAVQAFAVDTDAEIEQVGARADADVADFLALSESLQTQLRRAQLRRQLDLIDARTTRASDRAEARYESEEQGIYQTLLAAMYGNEEQIFDARKELAQRDSEDRRFEFESRMTRDREAEEDEFAFQERFLTRQISDLNRSEPVDEAALESAQNDLALLRENHDQAVSDFDQQARDFQTRDEQQLRDELAVVKAERQKVRLIYLQTDDPYRNTAVSLSIRNLGTNLKFDTVGYPMPRTVALSGSYAFLNTDQHTARVSTEVEFPLYGSPTLSDLQVGVGVEYGFADLLEIRAGYGFGSPERSFSAGVGLDFALGFTSYAIDYAFRPIPNYGFVHSIGVAIGF